MTKLLGVIAILFSISTFGQTAAAAYDRATNKTANKNFTGALKDFDEAIKLDPKYTDAYYNRAVTELFLKDYKKAIADFNKALKLRPGYIEAYMNLGLTRLKMGDTKTALKELDSAINIEPKHGPALFIRGQIKMLDGDRDGGCNDLNKAKEYGETHAQKMLDQYCSGGATPANTANEYLKLDWPKKEGWKVADRNENKERRAVEYLKNEETFQNWTEIGTMMEYPFKPSLPLDAYMNTMHQKAKQNCPQATLTLIEQDATAEYPWILFKIECSQLNPEAQLWYIVFGKGAMFVNFREVRQMNLSADLQKKWSAFFKTAKVMHK